LIGCWLLCGCDGWLVGFHFCGLDGELYIPLTLNPPHHTYLPALAIQPHTHEALPDGSRIARASTHLNVFHKESQEPKMEAENPIKEPTYHTLADTPTTPITEIKKRIREEAHLKQDQ